MAGQAVYLSSLLTSETVHAPDGTVVLTRSPLLFQRPRPPLAPPGQGPSSLQ